MANNIQSLTIVGGLCALYGLINSFSIKGTTEGTHNGTGNSFKTNGVVPYTSSEFATNGNTALQARLIRKLQREGRSRSVPPGGNRGMGRA